MLDNGRMESLGGHDDMVMALALSVQATKEYRDNIVILDADVWQNRLGGQMSERIEGVLGIESPTDAIPRS